MRIRAATRREFASDVKCRALGRLERVRSGQKSGALMVESRQAVA